MEKEDEGYVVGEWKLTAEEDDVWGRDWRKGPRLLQIDNIALFVLHDCLSCCALELLACL